MNRIKGSLMDLLQEDLAKAYDIFVDMDGVLTDFERRFEQFAGVTPDEYMSQKEIQYGKDKANEQFWDLVDKQIGVRFWAGMPWMPEGEELYKYIKKYKPTILTSPSREESSRIGKGVWVKRNMSGTPVKFGYKADGKAKFAGPNKILIDDREDNISCLESSRWNWYII
jgi:hypothetical protein